jgi:DNA mismatch repair ATPase MutS
VCEHSFGLNVAIMLGYPATIVERAQQQLAALEQAANASTAGDENHEHECREVGGM